MAQGKPISGGKVFLLIVAIIAVIATGTWMISLIPAGGVIVLTLVVIMVVGIGVGRWVKKAPPWLQNTAAWFAAHKAGTGTTLGLLACSASFAIIPWWGEIQEEAARQEKAEKAAAEAAEKAVKHKQLVADARFYTGKGDKEDQAIDAYEEAAKLGDLPQEDILKYTQLLVARGERLDKAGDLVKSVIALERAHDLAPQTKGLAEKLSDTRSRRDSEWAKEARESAKEALVQGLMEIDKGDADSAVSSLDKAVTKLERAKSLVPDLDGIDAELNVARGHLRKARVDKWIADGAAIAKDAKLCDTPKELSVACENIRRITRDDAAYGKAKKVAARLEKCRKQGANTLIKGLRDIMITQREDWADKYERSLLSEGMDVRVKLQGRNKNVVKIVYVLFNRAWAYQITDGGSTSAGSFLGELQKIGFKKVIFSDGFWESFFYDLNPDDEGEAMQEGLIKMGIGESCKI